MRIIFELALFPLLVNVASALTVERLIHRTTDKGDK